MEVQVQVAAQVALGEVAEAEERVFDVGAEVAAAEGVVVERDAEVELPLHAGGVAEEVEVIAPAGKEELPLQVGELGGAGGCLLAHAGVFEWYEQGGNRAPAGVFEGVEQIER